MGGAIKMILAQPELDTFSGKAQGYMRFNSTSIAGRAIYDAKLSLWSRSASGTMGIPLVGLVSPYLKNSTTTLWDHTNVTPMLSPVILFNLIIGIIGTLQVFAEPYVMFPGGSPARSTYFYTMYLFDNAFLYHKMGYACAMGPSLAVRRARLKWVSRCPARWGERCHAAGREAALPVVGGGGPDGRRPQRVPGAASACATQGLSSSIAAAISLRQSPSSCTSRSSARTL